MIVESCLRRSPAGGEFSKVARHHCPSDVQRSTGPSGDHVVDTRAHCVSPASASRWEVDVYRFVMAPQKASFWPSANSRRVLDQRLN